jgi:hypothetical protein
MQPHGVQSFALRIWRGCFSYPLSAPGQRNSTAALLTVCPMPQRSGIDTRDQPSMTGTQLNGDGLKIFLRRHGSDFLGSWSQSRVARIFHRFNDYATRRSATLGHPARGRLAMIRSLGSNPAITSLLGYKFRCEGSPYGCLLDSACDGGAGSPPACKPRKV